MNAALVGAASSALKLEAALDKVTAKLQSLEKEEKQEKAEEEGMFAKAVEKGELMKDLVEKIAEKVYDLGKELVESTIEVTDFGYRAEVALRHLNGETEEAQGRTTKLLEEAKQFALDAAQPVQSVTEAFLGLRRAGLSDEWVRPLTAAAGDLAALTGHPENFRQLVDVFENIALKGELTGRSLMALTSAGVSPAALAAKFGAKDFRELQEQLSKHPVGALEGLRAIEDVIKSTAHENVLGETFKESADTFGGGIQRIRDLWEIMLEDLNKDPIFKSLRIDFLELVNDVVANKPAIERAFTEIVEPIIKSIDDLVKNPQALKDFFSDAASVVREVAGVVSTVIDGVKWFLDHRDALKTGAAAAAGYAVAGPAGAAVAGGTVAYAQARHEEHDRLLEAGYSEHDANRFLGKFKEGGPINEDGIAQVHAGEYVVPSGGALVAGGSGGRTLNAPITINVHVEGVAGMTEEGLSLQLRDILPGALVPASEQLATTIGAA
jgi:hypothetical protein